MEVQVSYRGESGLRDSGTGQSLALLPNLSRDPVAFDGELKQPLRFREAMSALHDVVVSDLRYQPKDKTAYEEWKRHERLREQTIFREVYKQAKSQTLEQAGVTPEMERQYQSAVKRYWGVRMQLSDHLRKNDPELWRLTMPCDPVITVADDSVFFECFSADESSYGCLTVDREGGLGKSDNTQYGTTNVDYSWKLYDQFQGLRTYRQTRLNVDPEGFGVSTTAQADYREEKIDLPEGWLRGFMQIQSAMSLPMRKVTLSRECMYSVLAWMKRHRARKSPRALRFELLPGEAPRLVLEPWERSFVSHSTKYDGPPVPPIRVWGTRRLLFLSRVLPLVDRFEVYLLGTGLPSFWVARMGEMRLTIGNSGWTANDWTHGSAVDSLRPPHTPSADLVDRIAAHVREKKSVRLEDVMLSTQADGGHCVAALGQLAHAGQLIYDLTAGVYRWRQVMPRALGEAELGPPNPEILASQALVAGRKVKIESRQNEAGGSLLITARIENTAVEVFVNGDGIITRGSCSCSHHRKNGVRMGPCRHLLAAREAASSTGSASALSLESWYEWLRTARRN